MKKFNTLFLLFVCTYLPIVISAQDTDKVYLKNKELVEGKVLRVTESAIEIDPVGEKPFLLISRDEVSTLIYSDNTIVNFQITQSNNDNQSSNNEPEIIIKDFYDEMLLSPNKLEKKNRIHESLYYKTKEYGVSSFTKHSEKHRNSIDLPVKLEGKEYVSNTRKDLDKITASVEINYKWNGSYKNGIKLSDFIIEIVFLYDTKKVGKILYSEEVPFFVSRKKTKILYLDSVDILGSEINTKLELSGLGFYSDRYEWESHYKIYAQYEFDVTSSL